MRKYKTTAELVKDLSQPHQNPVFILYKKGKIKGRVQSYYYPGIGSGFLASGDEKIEHYHRRFKSMILVDMGKEFKILKNAKRWMEKHGYIEVVKKQGKVTV